MRLHRNICDVHYNFCYVLPSYDYIHYKTYKNIIKQNKIIITYEVLMPQVKDEIWNT